MTPTSPSVAGPVQPRRTEAAPPGRLRPASAGRITGGLWADRRRVNREVSIPGGWDRLHEAGNFFNLELAAGRAHGDLVSDLPFLDSDVHKWLEAAGWALTDPDLDAPAADRLRAQLAEAEDLLRAVQEPDGYLDSHFQVRVPGERFVQLAWGHELYCAGHLIQAAVAVHRSTGDAGLLEVARRVADLVVERFGEEPGRVDGVCGHPEIEMALVELYRETGHRPYLDRARYFVDRRGHGLLGDGRFGRPYWQDRVPVREQQGVEGHAVRQLYLLCGVVDLYAEEGDPTLLAAVERQWEEMVATKTYLTGGVGAHHKDEAFGDPYELPNERSYCETCAAIASVMLSWRLLMATGRARYADLLERTLYNGFLAGLSLDGQRYIYANPLQVRDDHQGSGDDGDYERVPWFRCACCPPNVMRTLASLEHYVLLGGADRAVLHQYVPGRFSAPLGDGTITLEVATGYPWDGRVTVTVAEAPAAPGTVALRVPDWADGATLSVNGTAETSSPSDGWWSRHRTWTAGDRLELELPLRPRWTRPDPRLDAARGTVALERGPIVYCFETADQPEPRLDDLTVDPVAAARPTAADPALGPVVALQVAGRLRPRPVGSWWPYADGPAAEGSSGDEVALTAVPYYTWGNRSPGAMRVWMPTA